MTITTDSGTVSFQQADLIAIQATGSRKDSGSSPISFTGNPPMTLTDTTGKVFDVTYAPGTLTITKREIVLTANSATKPYDGILLTANAPGWQQTSGSFAAGEGLESVTVEGGQLTAGSSANRITGYRLRAGTLEQNYSIITVDGTLTVTKSSAPLTIRVNSAEKIYDGTPLTNPTAVIAQGSLFSGDRLVYEVTGSLTDAGTAPNELNRSDVAIYHGADDVTENYVITPVNGILTVHKRIFSITGNTASFTYDGASHTVLDPATGVSYTYERQNGDRGLMTSHILTGVTMTGDTRTEVGSNPVTPSGGNITRGGEDVTENYQMIYVDGKITIESIRLVLTVDSLTATYDTMPHTVSTISIAGNLLPNHVLSYTLSNHTAIDVVASQQVDIATVTIVDKDTGVDALQYYEIVKVPGILRIIPAVAYVYGTTETNAWTGNYFQPQAFAVGLLADHSLTAYDFVSLPVSAIGVYNAKFNPRGTVIQTADGRDVTKNYTIVHIDGTQIIHGSRTTYRIEYYYDGELDAGQTIIRSGYQGDVIRGYPAKPREGYVLAYNTGLPFILFADSSLNVIRVYYVSVTTLNSPWIPAGIILNVGDVIE
jgi:hypothetical protein